MIIISELNTVILGESIDKSVGLGVILGNISRILFCLSYISLTKLSATICSTSCLFFFKFYKPVLPCSLILSNPRFYFYPPL